jgi:thiopurine S-methyltransferase
MDDNDLWRLSWKHKETPFHQKSTNPHLQAFWPQLTLAPASVVFVPLCGKSLDLVWLSHQGYRVLGLELSSIAVRSFFRENHLHPTRSEHGRFVRWQHGNIVILCGDLFDLLPADLADIDMVYDRAALTALPEAIRIRYAAHLQRTLPIASRIFLLTTEDMEDGDPPAQIAAEIHRLYDHDYTIVLTHTKDIQETDNSHAEEKVYLLTPRPLLARTPVAAVA